jgi:hypothetical protein
LYFVNHLEKKFDTYPKIALKQNAKNEPFFGILVTLLTAAVAIGTEAISNQAATSRFLVESKSELKPDTPID